MALFFGEALSTDADPVTTEFFNYYRGRVFHPRSINSNAAWTATTPLGYFNFPLQAHIDEISPRPTLIVTGTTHTDLYDQMDLIPFAKFASFSKENL